MISEFGLCDAVGFVSLQTRGIGYMRQLKLKKSVAEKVGSKD